MIGIGGYGMIPPGDLDQLTRFHPLNERSLLDDDDETNTRANEKQVEEVGGPMSLGADDTEMKGVKKEAAKRFRVRGGQGRARTPKVECSASFIEGQIANLGYKGFGSLSSRNDSNASDVSCHASAVNDLSLAMRGVALKSEKEKCAGAETIKIKRCRGRGRRIQKE